MPDMIGKLLGIVSLLCLFAGCGGGVDGPSRYSLSGSVTYDGKPVPHGEITFAPDVGNEGPGTTAQIVDGKYATISGKGTIGGPHSVRISGHSGGVDGAAPPPGTTEETTVLFTEYQTTADIPKSDGKMDFDVPPQ